MDEKNPIIESPSGISIYHDGTLYEYDSFANRYYMLEYGTVNSPDGKLMKRRISKALFEKIRQRISQNQQTA